MIDISPELQLDSVCIRCSGRGHTAYENPCKCCEGVKYVPTVLGQEIIDFLIRHNVVGAK